MSPDPANAGADLMNPQSWNAYAYVRGNPLALLDPSGMCASDDASCFSSTTRLCKWWQVWCWVSSPDFASDTHPAPDEDSWIADYNYSMSRLSGSGAGAGGGGGGAKPSNPSQSAPPKNGTKTCANGLGSGGVGVGAGYNLDLGVGPVGASSTGGVGAGGFHNLGGGATSGYSAGAFASGGGTAFAGPHVVGAPAQASNTVFAIGAYAGAGANVFATNAASVQQLSGPFTTVSVNVGYEVANIGFQVSFGGGIWSVSITPPIASVGFGAAASVITTNTATTRTGCH